MRLQHWGLCLEESDHGHQGSYPREVRTQMRRSIQNHGLQQEGCTYYLEMLDG